MLCIVSRGSLCVALLDRFFFVCYVFMLLPRYFILDADYVYIYSPVWGSVGLMFLCIILGFWFSYVSLRPCFPYLYVDSDYCRRYLLSLFVLALAVSTLLIIVMEFDTCQQRRRNRLPFYLCFIEGAVLSWERNIKL
jgi:hypothetical protein